MYYKQWAQARAHTPLKLLNLPILKDFEERLELLNILAHHVDEQVPGLVYSEGSPNFSMFKLTPNGVYIGNKNPMLHLWKRVDIDTTCITNLLAKANEKYKVEDEIVIFDKPYHLFLLQMASSKDLESTVKALHYATTNRLRTVFKTHPVPGDGTDFTKLWDAFKRHDLISDYTILVDKANVDSLIKNASFVYSSDSAATFNAVLYDIPVATFRPMDLSEIVPIINSPSDKITPVVDKDRFMSWYCNNLTIDIDKISCNTKLLRIHSAYISGKSIEEIF